jgi:choline-sulfatase
MKDSPPQPFLLFLPGMGAHPPYGAPKEFHEKWPVDIVKKKVSLRPPYQEGKPSYHSRTKGIPHYRNLTSLDDDFFYRIQATYLGMISYVDWMFGELLRGVKEAGLENNTAIFFSSDHGDFSGDYHMMEKWPGGADDILSRVPVYARIPGASPAAAGFVAKAPISLFDIPHTICELAGINVTGDGSGKYGINFGTSLKDQLLHAKEGDMSRFVYSEGGFGFRNEVFPMGSDHVVDDPRGLYYPRAMEEMSDDGNGSPKWVMRRNLTHKIVYRPRGRSELYDFTEDPRELRNLWDDHDYAMVKAELLSGLMEWLVETGDVSPMHHDPRGTPPFPTPASACAISGALGPTKDEVDLVI